jgi:hypothetical protein
MVDALCGDEQFFEYVPGAPDEGEDLLVIGLTPEQETARAALRTAMDDLVAGMTYDADSWPEQVVPPARCGDTGDTGLGGP